MARACKVTVGGWEYSTKLKAKAFYRDIRDRYRDGERLSIEDEGKVIDLLELHPESTSKIGCGIDFLSVETEKEYRRTRHFMIHRIDGSATDFSFLACFDGANLRKDVLGAMRRAIADQILEFRDRSLSVAGRDLVCPLSGEKISHNYYHVDHAPPGKFIVLVNGWLASHSLAIQEVEITPPADSQIIAEMTSLEQRNSWENFHRHEAILRLLSPKGNLSHANRVRETGSEMQ